MLVPTTCALPRLLVVLTPQLFLCTVMLMQVDVGKYANRYSDDIQKRTSKKKVGFTGSKHYNSLRPLNEWCLPDLMVPYPAKWAAISSLGSGENWHLMSSRALWDSLAYDISIEIPGIQHNIPHPAHCAPAAIHVLWPNDPSLSTLITFIWTN